MGDLERFQRISNGLIGSLAAEKVPATIFINERQLNVPGQRDARAMVLEQWLDAGFDLANHTYSHPSLNQVPLWQFQDDVVRGDVIMRPLVERRGRKLEWFRYPFLHSGTTEDVHQAVIEFLDRRGYRVAPVTVDYADYTFAGVFRNQRWPETKTSRNGSSARISSRSTWASRMRSRRPPSSSGTRSRRSCSFTATSSTP